MRFSRILRSKVASSENFFSNFMQYFSGVIGFAPELTEEAYSALQTSIIM